MLLYFLDKEHPTCEGMAEEMDPQYRGVDSRMSMKDAGEAGVKAIARQVYSSRFAAAPTTVCGHAAFSCLQSEKIPFPRRCMVFAEHRKRGKWAFL
jgi:hypothetical protein